MLHIIGVAHRAQAQTLGEDLTEAQAKFAQTLRAAVARIHPILIAEEDSEEALHGRNAISISRQIAGENAIEHRFCDPTQKQRRQIGYKDISSIQIEILAKDREGLSAEEICVRAQAILIARYLPKRERFWLCQLADRFRDQLIFVCGDFHVETFGDLLRGKGLPYEIIDRGIGLTEYDRQLDQKARRYLEDHPGLDQ